MPKVTVEMAGNRKRVIYEQVVDHETWTQMERASKMATLLWELTQQLRAADKYGGNPFARSKLDKLDDDTVAEIRQWIYAEATDLGITDVLY